MLTLSSWALRHTSARSTDTRDPRTATFPFAKAIRDWAIALPAFFDNTSAATGRSRSRRVTHAFRTAAPLRSAPEDAAVADVLGTLSVVVGITRTRAAGRPSSRIATPWIFV